MTNELRKWFAEDYDEMIKKLGEIITRQDRLSREQIAELAAITNSEGEPSQHIIYNMTEGRRKIAIPELRRLVKVFEKFGMNDAVNIIHYYLFGEIGTLERFQKSDQLNDEISDDLHHITAKLGRVTNSYLDAVEDNDISFDEMHDLMLKLDDLNHQVYTALYEVRQMMLKRKAREQA